MTKQEGHNQATTEPRPKLKLSGTDGNAFAILGKASGAMRTAGCSNAHIDRVMTEAQSGDYGNLLATIGKYCEVR